MPKRKRKSKRKKGKSKGKKKKTSGVKRPMSSFFLFSKYNRPIVKKKYPNMQLKEVSQKLGQLWRGLRDDQKEMWKKRAKEEADRAVGEPDIVRRRARDIEQARRARIPPSNRARILQRAAGGSLQNLNRSGPDLDAKLPWLCKTCHKKNIPAHASCAVCGTKKNKHSIQPPLPSKVYKPPKPIKSIVPSKFKYPRLRNALTKIKLERFYTEFEKQEVCLETLVDLVRNNDSDLKEIVPLIGPRRELKSYIQKHYIKSCESDEETIVPKKRKTPPPMPSPPKKKKLFNFISESDSDSSSSDPPILFRKQDASPPPSLSTFSQFERRESESVEPAEKPEAKPPEKPPPADPPKPRKLPDWCFAPLTKPFPRPDPYE